MQNSERRARARVQVQFQTTVCFRKDSFDVRMFSFFSIFASSVSI
jgi:hypothetical protein